MVIGGEWLTTFRITDVGIASSAPGWRWAAPNASARGPMSTDPPAAIRTATRRWMARRDMPARYRALWRSQTVERSIVGYDDWLITSGQTGAIEAVALESSAVAE